MIIRVDVELTDEQLKVLAGNSRVARIDPRKRYSMPEYKEHAKYKVRRLIADFLMDKGLLTNENVYEFIKVRDE